MMRDLTDKHIRFCDEYLICFNATEAAMKAGYSKRSARAIGSKLLTKHDIQRYLAARKKKVLEKLEISQERTILEIARIAYADPRALFNEDGTLKSIHELDDHSAATISSFEMEELFAGTGEQKIQVGQTKKVRQWSKTEAINLLGKHQGIFAVDNDQKKNEVVAPFSDDQVDKIITVLRKKK